LLRERIMMISLLIVCACLLGTPESVPRLVEYHVQRYPRIQVQDVFKMLYQGEFGIGHLLGDGTRALQYLREELAQLDSTTGDEELLEPVSADGGMVRVNLRPYRRAGHSPELLVRAMMESASDTRGDTARFVSTWREFISSAPASGFDPEELRTWDDRVRRGDLRVVHHSGVYTGAYRPAYRVCRRAVIEKLLSSSGGGRP